MNEIEMYSVRMVYFTDIPEPDCNENSGEYYIVNVMETKDYEFARFIAETVNGYIDFN